MFTNPVVGGLQLIRNAIQSINYVPGTSGWSLNRDGTFDLGGGLFRDTVAIVKTVPPGPPEITSYPISFVGASTARLDTITCSFRGVGATTIRDATSTAAFVVTKPAGIRLTDCLVAWIAINPITVNLTPPAGWTQLFVNSDTTVKFQAWYKIATAVDVAAANYSFTVSATCTGVAGMTAYAGVDEVDVIPEPALSSINTGATATAHATPTYATSGDRILISACAIGAAASANTFTGTDTERIDVQNASGAARVSFAVYDTNGPVAPFNATKTITSSLTTTDAVKAILSFKRRGFGSYLTVNKPPGVQYGDLLLAFFTMNIGGVWTPPPNWFTLGFLDDGANMRTYVFWKVARRYEADNYRFFRGATAAQAVVAILAYHNTDPLNPIGTEWSSKAETAVVTNHTTTAITPAGSDRWLVSALTTFNNLGLTVTSTTGTDVERIDNVGVEVTPVSLAVFDSNTEIPAASTTRTLVSSVATDNSTMWAIAIRPKPADVLDPGTYTLASIDDTGAATFPRVTTEELQFGTTNLVDANEWYEKAPRGVVARVTTPESMGQYQTLISDGNSYMNVFTIPFTSEGAHRVYRVTGKTMTIRKLNNPTGADLVRWELWTSTSGVPTTRLSSMGQDVEIDNTWAFAFPINFEDHNFPEGLNYIHLRLASRNTTSSANVINLAFNNNVTPDDFFMTVEDIGAHPGQFGNIGLLAGGTVLTKTYTAIWSKSYDSAGNPIASPDTNNSIYQGNFDGAGGRAAYGNERALLGFDGTQIRSDLLGKSLIDAKLYLYCFTSEDTIGSLSFGAHNSTSAPANYGSAVIGSNEWNYEKEVSYPGWSIFNLFDDASGLSSGTMMQEFLVNNENGIALKPTILGVEATGYRGYGFSVSLRPYIVVRHYA